MGGTGMGTVVQNQNKKPRPKLFDIEVIERAIELSSSAMNKYFKGDNLSEDYTLQCKNELRDAIFSGCLDVYRICRELEKNFWEANDELYNFIDVVLNNQYNAHILLEKEWVKNNSFIPKFTINDKVNFNKTFDDNLYTGVITRVHNDRLRYSIKCPQLNHVDEGVGVHSIILEEEKIIEKI